MFQVMGLIPRVKIQDQADWKTPLGVHANLLNLINYNPTVRPQSAPELKSKLSLLR